MLLTLFWKSLRIYFYHIYQIYVLRMSFQTCFSMFVHIIKSGGSYSEHYFCTLCKKIYTCETGRRLGARFRKHLRDVEPNDKDASKPVERHFNLPNHSTQKMAIGGLSMHQGNTESRKNLEQKLGSLNSHGINKTFLIR